MQPFPSGSTAAHMQPYPSASASAPLQQLTGSNQQRSYTSGGGASFASALQPLAAAGPPAPRARPLQFDEVAEAAVDFRSEMSWPGPPGTRTRAVHTSEGGGSGAGGGGGSTATSYPFAGALGFDPDAATEAGSFVTSLGLTEGLLLEPGRGAPGVALLLPRGVAVSLLPGAPGSAASAAPTSGLVARSLVPRPPQTAAALPAAAPAATTASPTQADEVSGGPTASRSGPSAVTTRV